MKIIDILNKIANGEKPPKKITFREQEYEYDIGERDYYYCNCAIYWLFDGYVITDILNDEVEILETTYKQDKIEKLDEWDFSGNDLIFAVKINEIIEVLNKE